MLLNFGDRTRTGVFSLVWPLTLSFSLNYLINDFKKVFNYKYVSLKMKNRSQQHAVFPGGHPSKYLLRPMLLNFGDRTRTGVFSMVWPLTLSFSLNYSINDFKKVFNYKYVFF